MQARNPKHSEDGSILLEVSRNGEDWMPFAARPDDRQPYGRDLYQRALDGEFGEIDPGPTGAELIERKRQTASLSRMQFMLALDDAGLLDDAETLVDDPNTPRRVKIMWRNATQFDRTNPELVQMAQSMELTETEMDSVFGIE